MDTDAMAFQQPTGARPPDRREMLWNELERLHAQLGIEPPTATYDVDDLEAEVVMARRATAAPTNPFHQLQDAAALQHAAQQAGAVLEGTFGERLLTPQQEAAYRRTHKTWRNFYGPIFFGEQLTPE